MLQGCPLLGEETLPELWLLLLPQTLPTVPVHTQHTDLALPSQPGVNHMCRCLPQVRAEQHGASCSRLALN